ncbi:sigma-70 family RNA polymerase sigma factor [Clostridium puniceum]|nr:sigma-70 family RNA polymerase sigma factor [Clostridium puniceum]
MGDKKQIKLKNEIKEMSLDEAYKQFKKFIYKICQSWIRQYDIEDLQQVASIGFLKAYNTYEVTKDILFTTYLVRIINNEIKIYHRKNKKHSNNFSLNASFNNNEDDSLELIDIISDDINYEEKAISKIQCDELRNSISNLPEKDKYIVESVALNGKTQCEISKKLNLSESSVSRIYKKALLKIKETMEGENTMPIAKITKNELISGVKQYGTKAKGIEIIAKKYNLSPGTIRVYLDEWDVRKYSKDYLGRKAKASSEADKGSNIQEASKPLLQEVKFYKGSIGEYKIDDSFININFNVGNISLKKEDILNFIAELKELSTCIG